MKKIFILIAMAQLVGCANDHINSVTTSTEGNPTDDKITCSSQGRAIQARQSFETVEDSVTTLATAAGQYDNFIVKYKAQSVSALSLEQSGSPVHEYKVRGITFQNVTRGSYAFKLQGTAEQKLNFLSELARQEDVEYIEPDYPIYSITPSHDESAEQNEDVVDESTYSTQWALPKIKLQEAWTLTKGSQDVVVAVLDSGIDYTHKDLKNNMWKNAKEIAGNKKDDDGNGYVDDIYGWNFVKNDANPITTSKSNHGTHVAGIIGGNRGDGKGIFGVAPNVKLMALRFIGETGSGLTSAAIRGIDYAVAKKVFAINNSWGSSGGSKALSDAIDRAEKAGVLFVVAAGNGKNGSGYSIDSESWYPASYSNSNILTVAATSSSDKLTTFSNFGSGKVDVAAPGLDILSTVTGNSSDYMSGTSMAAPLVTGLAVLVKAANPALTAKQVITVIRSSVDKYTSLTGKVGANGRVNAYKAVKYAIANQGKEPLGEENGDIMPPCAE